MATRDNDDGADFISLENDRGEIEDICMVDFRPLLAELVAETEAFFALPIGPFSDPHCPAFSPYRRLLTGATACGKSTLLRLLASRFSSRFPALWLPSDALSPSAVRGAARRAPCLLFLDPLPPDAPLRVLRALDALHGVHVAVFAAVQTSVTFPPLSPWAAPGRLRMLRVALPSPRAREALLRRAGAADAAGVAARTAALAAPELREAARGGDVRPAPLRAFAPRAPPALRFADVGGLRVAKAALRALLADGGSPSLPPSRALEIGDRQRTPLRVLLHGPSGVGKWRLALALAGELGGNVLAVRASDLLSAVVGASEARARALFATARACAPCALLLAHLEALAPPRDGRAGNADRLLSALLVELDGAREEGEARVDVVATCADIARVEPAMVRPGRIDARVEVPKPDAGERGDIARVLARDVRATPAAREALERRAEAMEGATGAEIAKIVREAGVRAVLRGDSEIHAFS